MYNQTTINTISSLLSYSSVIHRNYLFIKQLPSSFDWSRESNFLLRLVRHTSTFATILSRQPFKEKNNITCKQPSPIGCVWLSIVSACNSLIGSRENTYWLINPSIKEATLLLRSLSLACASKGNLYCDSCGI